MQKSVSDALTILRQLTSRNDNSDPQWTDDIMIGYLNDFSQGIMSMELPLIEKRGFYTFSTVANQDTYTYPVETYVLLQPPVYVDGDEANWYQDPDRFYSKWQLGVTYTATQPTDILLYNDQLILRAPPDDVYEINIDSYQVNDPFDDESDMLEQGYWWRYIAYGAALDILSDYNEDEHYASVFPRFQRYKNMIKGRRSRQLMNQRSEPNF